MWGSVLRVRLVAVCILLFVVEALAATHPIITAPVTDLANVLAPDVSDRIARRIRSNQASHRVQVAVLLTASTNGEPIADYAFHVAQASHLGDAKADSGILVVIDTGGHHARIEVGRGLEGGLTDLQSSTILEKVQSDLHAGRYQPAVDQILDGIFAATAGASTAAADGSDAKKWQAEQASKFDHPGGRVMPWSIVAVVLVALLLVSVIMQWLPFWWKGALVTLVIGGGVIPLAFHSLSFWPAFYVAWAVGMLFGTITGALYREERLTAVWIFVSAAGATIGAIVPYKLMMGWKPPWEATDVYVVSGLSAAALLIGTWVVAAVLLAVLALFVLAPVNLVALARAEGSASTALHRRMNGWFRERFEIVMGVLGVIGEVGGAAAKEEPTRARSRASSGSSDDDDKYEGGGGNFGGGGASSDF